MIETLITFLQNNILPLGPFGVFLASVTEEVIAPIPSALVMMMSGFLFVTGPVSLANILRLCFYVGVPAASGVTLGSLVIYAVAFWGGRPFLEKWGKWIGLHWSDVERMKFKFESSRNDEVAIIGARVLPVIPSVAISAFCGFIRMNFFKYLILTFSGMFARGVIMGAIGWQVGNVYHKYASLVSRIESYVLWIVVVSVVIFVIFAYIKRKKSLPKDEI